MKNVSTKEKIKQRPQSAIWERNGGREGAALRTLGEVSKHMTVYEARVAARDEGQALSAIFSGRHRDPKHTSIVRASSLVPWPPFSPWESILNIRSFSNKAQQTNHGGGAQLACCLGL